MESLNGPSNLNDFAPTGKQATLPPRNPIRSVSPTGSHHLPGLPIDSQTLFKPTEGLGHHQRASSESLLIEEQPAWLDELLSEPDSPPSIKGHRRSASDSATYLNRAFTPFTEDSRLNNYSPGPLWVFQAIDHHSDLWQWNSFCKNRGRAWEMPVKKGVTVQKSGSSNSVHKLGNLPSTAARKQMQEGKEGYSSKSDGSQTSSVSRNDCKRAKQQNAQRARIRRLQYISELEMNVQMLQAEGSEVSSAIHFFDQQLILLSMENRALKQRLDSLAQVQKLKQLERDMLERERVRLQFLHHQQQQQHSQYSYNQPNSRDLESQFATLAI